MLYLTAGLVVERESKEHNTRPNLRRDRCVSNSLSVVFKATLDPS